METQATEMMCERFNSKIVHYCAPTLAAIKPSNLFTVSFLDDLPHIPLETDRAKRIMRSGLAPAMRGATAEFSSTDVAIRVLALRRDNALIFVFRPQLVERVLADPRTAAYLRELGYDTSSLGTCLTQLARRFRAYDRSVRTANRQPFPHEIGFFLGYPHDDVIAFIEGNGECVCSGCWKAYGDPCNAQACFDAYRACVKRMDALHASGIQIGQLATMTLAS
ncbi:DUF3793 family protein [Curtanaerobium respiraculi]|uniref:DUF3793 family protein n=1 Tax=Curtanaerobium respiraculi TaxID=2949669 RepID=UPI0024B39003|nr:DUF3793 family protein [Curtanaerobium respiraculi]